MDQTFQMLEDIFWVTTLRFVHYLRVCVFFFFLIPSKTYNNDVWWHIFFIGLDVSLYGTWFPKVKDSAFSLGPDCVYIWSWRSANVSDVGKLY